MRAELRMYKPERAWFMSFSRAMAAFIQVATSLILGELLHILVLHLHKMLGALALLLGQMMKVAPALQSHILKLEVEAQREAGIRSPRYMLTRWLMAVFTPGE